MNEKLKLAILITGFAAAALAMTACENTWHGAGRDVENIGEDMQGQYR